nr:endodeoxyribonuclease I [Methylophilales phage MEP434]
MRTRRFTKKLTSKQVGLKHGFRSGLEEKVAEQLREKGVKYEFEETKLKYVKPQKTHTYTPDFFLPEQNIYIESKGLFATADRQKMILVKEQHPDLDIRFVFSNANSRISKKSKTTYAMWADKNGFQWSNKIIPQEWLNEK